MAGSDPRRRTQRGNLGRRSPSGTQLLLLWLRAKRSEDVIDYAQPYPRGQVRDHVDFMLASADAPMKVRPFWSMA
jgi:hypothetical protein